MKQHFLSTLGRYTTKRFIQFGGIGGITTYTLGNLINGTQKAIFQGANFVQSLADYCPITTSDSPAEVLSNDISTGLQTLGAFAAAMVGAYIYNSFANQQAKGWQASEAGAIMAAQRREKRKQKKEQLGDLEEKLNEVNNQIEKVKAVKV